jgi:ribosomal-protein-alanine N-acetyltransferase
VTIRLVPRFEVDDRVLSALHARAFGSGPTEVRPWSRQLERHALTWVGAFEGDELIGFVQVCRDGGGHAFLLDTAVDPGRQRGGVGRSLVETAIRETRAAGCEWLHVDFEPHLRRFYLDGCGFRSTPAGLINLRSGETNETGQTNGPGEANRPDVALERLREDHAGALLEFEATNRGWFARSIPDRGDDYFTHFEERHTALLAEQATGRCHFHVMTDDAGVIVGRFNLVDVADGSAELGFRMAERATGRGLAKFGVRRILGLARDEYGLRRLTARARPWNAGSLGVLRGTGFRAVGAADDFVQHVRELHGDEKGKRD